VSPLISTPSTEAKAQAKASRRWPRRHGIPRHPRTTSIAWQEGGWVHGDVLDIGCGLGDNAIYLAQQGFKVTGLDLSPTALITAERRAKDAGVTVKFAVTDSTKLEGYTDAFDTVVDSGMFHCLDDDGKRSYAAAAHRATRPGATLLLSCFSATQTHPTRNGHGPWCPSRCCAMCLAARAGISNHWSPLPGAARSTATKSR